jgi:hypothetical protein
MRKKLTFACLFITLLALMPCAPGAHGAGLTGRFFYAPEERAALDRLRIVGERSQSRPRDQAFSGTEEDTPDPVFTFQGMVLRSSGKRTIWLNDRSYNEHELPPGMRVPTWSERGDMAVEIRGRGGFFTLKPGQTVRLHGSRQGAERK